MGKNRELASIVSSKTWRTIVVAGAMLGVPLVLPACGSKPKPVTPTNDDRNQGNPNSDKPTVDEKKAADDAAAKKAADDEAARLLAEKEAADKAAKEKEEADKKAQEEADRKAKEDAAKRPRGGDKRPTGRGFILA